MIKKSDLFSWFTHYRSLKFYLLEKEKSKRKSQKDSQSIKVHGSLVIASKNNNYRLHLITRF